MLTSTRTRLITGDLDAIEAALGDTIVEARGDDPLAPVTVLVGSVLLRRYLPRALARRGVPQINVDYVLPQGLAARLARHAGDGRTRLTPESERLLVRDVAREADGYFAGMGGREGFVRALRSLFRELDGGAFTASTFRTAADAGSPSLPDSGRKLRELVRLYALFEERRARFIASSDDYRAADVSLLEGPLLVYGAWSLPEVACGLIERIAAGHDVTVFLPSSGLDADDAHAALRARLGGLTPSRSPEASGVYGPGDAAAADAPRATPKGPAALAGAIFRDGEHADGADGVSLASAPDTVREVWEAARACIEWAREGVRFHEMAVVYRSSDPYRTLVDEIFREADIPTYLHGGRLLSEHPLGRRVLALLDLAADEHFPRAKVMEFLTETELPRATVDGRVSPSEWEGFTRDAGIIDGPAQWQDRLQRLAQEKRHDALREGREWLADHADRIERFAEFAGTFATDLAEHPREATWAEHLAYLRTLAGKYAKGVEKILVALDDLHVLGAVREPVSFEVFCRAVRDDLEARDVTRVFGEPVRAFGREGVAVLDASSLRHLRFRAVYLLGVAERAWPPPARPDPLLLERERRAINEAGAGVIPLRTEPDDEALTFWLAVQSAGERLRISYARAEAGSSGKHLPSYFFRVAVDALEGRRVAFADVDASRFVRRFSAGRLAADDPRDALTPAEYDRTLVHAYLTERAGAENVRAIERESPPFVRALQSRQQRWSNALTPYDGCMIEPAAVAAALARSPFARAVSPSRLETYATCPYRYFMSYVLHVEPIEEPERLDRMDPRERGSLVHDILERFMREFAPGDPPRPEARERHIARLLEIAHEEGDERMRRGVTGKAFVWRIDAGQIDEDLVRWYDVEAADGSGLVPHAFEVMFGPLTHDRGRTPDPLSSTEPLAIRVDGREVLLQGRIDRLDWDAARTRFRVIDYKTGSSTSSVKLDGGQSLQLPIYLHAAEKLLGIPAEDGEAQYFYVSSKGGFKRAEISGAEVAARGADVDAIFTTIAEGIDAGFFAPNPGKNEEHCKWCDFRAVCDARIGRIAERKRGDGRGAAFFAMGDIE